MPIIEKIVKSLKRLFGPQKGVSRKRPTQRAAAKKALRRKSKSIRSAAKKTKKRPAKSYRQTSKSASKKAVKKKTPKRSQRKKASAPKTKSRKPPASKNPGHVFGSKIKEKTLVKGQKTFPAAKTGTVKKEAAPRGREILAGEITHFFSKIGVAVVHLKHYQLAVGDKIHVTGKSTDFRQKVKSLQIESVDVKIARRGKMVGLKTDEPAKVGDQLYKIP